MKKPTGHLRSGPMKGRPYVRGVLKGGPFKGYPYIQLVGKTKGTIGTSSPRLPLKFTQAMMQQGYRVIGPKLQDVRKITFGKR
jgi:hypothetical protein